VGGVLVVRGGRQGSIVLTAKGARGGGQRVVHSGEEEEKEEL